MGIKATYDIERSTAIAVIVSKMYNCSNGRLANMLREFDEGECRNYCVVNNLSDDKGLVIKTVSEF